MTFIHYKHSEISSSCKCCNLSVVILNLNSLSGRPAYPTSEIRSCFECLASPHNLKMLLSLSASSSSSSNLLLFRIQAWFEIQQRKNGEVGTFKWSVHTNPSQLACSPFFEKWNRRWCLIFAKKGDNLEYGPEYVQGVSPFHLALK